MKNPAERSGLAAFRIRDTFSLRCAKGRDTLSGMVTTPMLLKVDRVSKRFQTGGGQGFDVLQDVSLELAPGESLAIVGPSGSGKSTLLHIMGTLDRPSSGTVFLEGQDLNSLNELQLAQIRNRQIGFIFQSHYLLPQCTVLENVLVPTLATPGVEPDNRVERARSLLERVGLAARIHHRPGQLSGGERQRAAVARALINRPKLLLADEPTGSLDHMTSESLAALLTELNAEQGMGLVLVTHALDLAKRMRRVWQLRDGRLLPFPNIGTER
jgi:lipoprotein-releasing system ATP-binding protein